MSETVKTIGVIGGGAWGTALAQTQAVNFKPTLMWAREPDVVQSINDTHENKIYLPDVTLHPDVAATIDVMDVVSRDILLVVVPAQHLRATLETIGRQALRDKTIVLCSKGIEIETGELLSDIVRQMVPTASIAVLTGPTFAREIANGLPSAVTIASHDLNIARDLAIHLGSKTFRPYASDDMIGAELGGALKNIMAIACGIVAGMKYGDSARAALLTRGMNEMMRMSLAMGGKRETLMGMCGMGDLVLTATSMQSRNCSLGFALGEGKSLEDIMGARIAVTEGVHTARAVAKLAKKQKIDLPIITAVDEILHSGKPAEAVINDLLSRPFGDER